MPEHERVSIFSPAEPNGRPRLLELRAALSQTTTRVLYIEDAFDQALLVKAFFNALPGYQVTHAQDGDQAIKLVESQRWDLIVTDLNLPGADGFTVIRRARHISPDVPILVTTGYTQAQYEEQALRAGADQVMIKPLNQDEFTTRVVAMVEQDTGTDPELDDLDEVILVIEGRLGDAEMGCGGTLMKAVDEHETVVVIPILNSERVASHEELKAASIAASILSVELRVDRDLFGSFEAQKALIAEAVAELRPTTVYLPAPDDRDSSRREASLMGIAATGAVAHVFGYETATTGLDFLPTRFVDVRAQMVLKMEALAAYQSAGAARVDLRPRMAQAYARYWGRFKDFTEVEAFQAVNRD